jgi:hypothetical protein
MCHAGPTGPNTPGVFDADSTSSPHRLGVPFVFGDGSVHFLSNSIDINTWMALATQAPAGVRAVAGLETRAGYNVGPGSAVPGAVDPAALTVGSTISDALIRSHLQADINKGLLQAPNANTL